MRVSTAELIKNFGTVADKALQEPVTVTKNGRDRFVLVEVAEFVRMKRRDRRVIKIEDWTEEEFDLMEKQIAEHADYELDKELVGWKP